MGYMELEGSSFVPSNDRRASRAVQLPSPAFRCCKSDPNSKRRKNIYISVTSNMYFYELIPYPSDKMSPSC